MALEEKDATPSSFYEASGTNFFPNICLSFKRALMRPSAPVILPAPVPANVFQEGFRIYPFPVYLY